MFGSVRHPRHTRHHAKLLAVGVIGTACAVLALAPGRAAGRPGAASRVTQRLAVPSAGNESLYVLSFKVGRGRLPRVYLTHRGALPKTLTILTGVRRDPAHRGRGLAAIVMLRRGPSAGAARARIAVGGCPAGYTYAQCAAMVLGFGGLQHNGNPVNAVNATNSLQAQNVAQSVQPNFGLSSHHACSPASPFAAALSSLSSHPVFGTPLGGFSASQVGSFVLHDGCAQPYAQQTLFHSALGAGGKVKVPAGTGLIAAISCPTASLCVAGDASGNVITSTNPTGGAGAWHLADVDATNGVFALSCPSAGFCAAGDSAGLVATTSAPTGGVAAWKVSSPINSSNKIYGLSCPSPALCVAGDDSGSAVTSTNPAGGTWSAAPLPTNGHSLNAVSCPSTTFCATVDAAGDVFTTADPPGGPSAWARANVDGGAFVYGVSCPSSALCVAVDDTGRVLSSTSPAAGSWRTTTADGSHHLYGVSCASPSLCVAVDGAGNVVTSTNPGGGAWQVANVDGTNVLYGVSCPTASLCVAVDGAGHVLTSTSPTGGAGAWTVATVDHVAPVHPPPYHPAG